MGSPDLTTEQAMPVPNDSQSIQSLVRADLDVREQLGIERYGSTLQPHNGRDALRDAYEEAMDLTLYLRQAIEERPRDDVAAAVAEIQRRYDADRQRWADLEAEFRRQLAYADKAREAARRLSGLEPAMLAAGAVLEEVPRTCRFHGSDFGLRGFESGLPRCDSCKQPYRVSHALSLLRSASENRVERGDPGE